MQPPLFFAFDASVPDAKACLDQVYEVFSSYRAPRGFCRQCFTPEQEEQICGPRNVRTADYAVFSPIYFEHPNCSGGVATFRHWLPRALECAAFDTRPFPMLPDQIARLGLLSWPLAEQQALRNVFSQAAANWFATGEPAPLGQQVPDDVKGNWLPDIWTAEILLSALTYLRVDPVSLARHMLATDTSWATLGLAAAIGRPSILDDIGYLVLEDTDDEAAMRSAFAALDRRARAGFHHIVTYEVLMNRWEALTARGEEKLAAHLLEAMDRSDPPQFTEQEQADDERLLARIVRA
ncbi:hypothetical protein ACFWXH_22495 [Mesorhizobium sp. NPDC059054]|uniref:hypothetical protein n=1 Tax=Mesorhizobium sp. NPDC059054 TaxID=3346711 RepID=UPI0036C22F5B